MRVHSRSAVHSHTPSHPALCVCVHGPLRSAEQLLRLMRSPNPVAEAGSGSPLLDQVETAVMIRTVRNVASWAAATAADGQEEPEEADSDEGADAEAADDHTAVAVGAEDAAGEEHDVDVDNGDEIDDADEYVASDAGGDNSDVDSDVVYLTPTAARPLRPPRRSARGEAGRAEAAQIADASLSPRRRITQSLTALQESSQPALMSPEPPSFTESPPCAAASGSAPSATSPPPPPRLPLMEVEENEEKTAAAEVPSPAPSATTAETLAAAELLTAATHEWKVDQPDLRLNPKLSSTLSDCVKSIGQMYVDKMMSASFRSDGGSQRTNPGGRLRARAVPTSTK